MKAAPAPTGAWPSVLPAAAKGPPTLEKGEVRVRWLGLPTLVAQADFIQLKAGMEMLFLASLPRIVPDTAKASVGTGAEKGLF